MTLMLLKELIEIILNSSDPVAAIKRAKEAAATEALNIAADEALKRL